MTELRQTIRWRVTFQDAGGTTWSRGTCFVFARFAKEAAAAALLAVPERPTGFDYADAAPDGILYTAAANDPEPFWTGA